MTITSATFYAVAVSTALAGIGAATVWAIQARDADRACRDAEKESARLLEWMTRFRRNWLSAESKLVTMREELRQAKLALVAADAELERKALDAPPVLVVDSSSSRPVGRVD